MSADAAGPVDRRARRKAETRDKLVAAARVVFARQGVETAKISDITDEADIGFGSFYNHFDGKDALSAAVVEAMARELGATIDEATAGLDDPAEVVAVAHRAVVEQAVGDPELGWLLLRLELSHDVLSTGLGSYALRDIERGRASGRFDVTDVPLALAATGGALLGAVRAALQGRAGEDVARHHAAAVLRMLGVPGPEAAEVVARPSPIPDS